MRAGMPMSGGTTSGGTAEGFFKEVVEARALGATNYSSGTRKISFAGPPALEPTDKTVAQELDYAQIEQVVHTWLERQGLDMNAFQAIIRQQEELLSA